MQQAFVFCSSAETYRRIFCLSLVFSSFGAISVAVAQPNFGTPTPVLGPINDQFGNGTPSISQHGLSLYFSSNRAGTSGPADLWVSHRASHLDPWGPVENLGAPINTPDLETAPYISDDLLELFFIREDNTGDRDLWHTRRATLIDDWETPTQLSLNTESGEGQPGLTGNGLILYFSSDRLSPGDSELFVAQRPSRLEPFGIPTHLFAGSWPNVTLDGLTLYYAIQPATGVPPDIYWRTRGSINDPFGPAVFLLSISSPFRDSDPVLSPDGSTLYFDSTRPGVPNGGPMGNLGIWQVPVFSRADFDQNGSVDCEDVDPLIAEIVSGTNDELFDLTGDGLVDFADRDAWLAIAGAHNLPSGNAYLLGDANLDGVVDVSDFNEWNNHKFLSTSAWCQADFNADGSTDVSDFNVWNNHKFQMSDGFQALPEPNSAIAIVMVIVSVIIFRTRLWRVDV